MQDIFQDARGAALYAQAMEDYKKITAGGFVLPEDWSIARARAAYAFALREIRAPLEKLWTTFRDLGLEQAIVRDFVGLDSGQIVNPGDAVTIQGNVEVPFKAQKLVVHEGHAFSLLDIRIGNHSAFISNRSIPCTAFSPENGILDPLDIPVATPMLPLLIAVRNEGKEPARFLATFLGRVLDRGPGVVPYETMPR